VLKCISKLDNEVNRHRPKSNETLFTNHRAKFFGMDQRHIFLLQFLSD
jgi:hypothetical protein